MSTIELIYNLLIHIILSNPLFHTKSLKFHNNDHMVRDSSEVSHPLSFIQCIPHLL